MASFPVVVHHHSGCGTSRKVIAAIRDAGLEPQIVEYLKTGWTREQLEELVARMGVSPREILRERGTRADELGLTDPAASGEAIIAAMILDPILVNRPIVVTSKGAALCRPAELVLGLL